MSPHPNHRVHRHVEGASFLNHCLHQWLALGQKVSRLAQRELHRQPHHVQSQHLAVLFFGDGRPQNGQSVRLSFVGHRQQHRIFLHRQNFLVHD